MEVPRCEPVVPPTISFNFYNCSAHDEQFRVTNNVEKQDVPDIDFISDASGRAEFVPRICARMTAFLVVTRGGARVRQNRYFSLAKAFRIETKSDVLKSLFRNPKSGASANSATLAANSSAQFLARADRRQRSPFCLLNQNLEDIILTSPFSAYNP